MIHFERTNEHYPTVRTKGHAFLRDRPRGVWYPDAVGVVPGYPKTHETWLRKQVTGLANIIPGCVPLLPPFAWKGSKEGLAKLRAENRAYAEKKVSQMAIKFEDPRAEQAMTALVEIVTLKDEKGKQLNSNKDVTAAASIVLNFTQSKPVTKNEHVVKAAEDWLEGLGE